MLNAPTDGLTQSGTFGGQPTFTTTPGTTVDNVTGDITNLDGSYAGNIVDEFKDPTQNLNNIDLGNPFNDPRVVSEEFGLVGTPSYIDPIMDSNLMDIRQQQNQEATTLGSQINSAFENVKDKGVGAIESFKNKLVELGGTIKEGFDNVIEFGDTQIDVGKTLGTGVINYLGRSIFGPVGSFLGTALGAVKDTPEQSLTRGIVDELKASGKDYGFNIQSGNLNQDPFGRNPVSALGDYEQTLANDAVSTSTTKMGLAKKEFAQDYFNVKAEKASGVEIDKGTVLGPGEAPGNLGDFTTGDVNIVDEVALTGKDDFDTTNEASVNQADVEAGLATESIADIDPADDFEVSGDIADIGTAMDLIGPAPTPQEIPDRNRGDGGGSGQISDAQAAANRDAARGGGGGSSGGGGGKIVCTMMNESYGFGSFRNKIWLRHSKDLAPEYQKGYHKIFLPLVKLSKNNKVLKTMLEHIAVHRTIDIRQESRGKVHLLGRVYRKILEPICYLGR
jgi:uncharacterized membrane protein YgcG